MHDADFQWTHFVVALRSSPAPRAVSAPALRPCSRRQEPRSSRAHGVSSASRSSREHIRGSSPYAATSPIPTIGRASSRPRSESRGGSTSASTTPASRPVGPTQQRTLEAFNDVMRVNVEAVFALSQAVGEHMLAQGSGSVINVSSMFGLVAATPVPDAPYVASKSAVIGLTRELANQWAPHGVRVNAIAPGWFATEMNAELVQDERSLRWLQRQCPMGRRGARARARRRPPLPRDGRLLVLHGTGDRGRRRVDDPLTGSAARLDARGLFRT